MKAPGAFGPLNAPFTSWRGCRVWLVGASTGIGRATASALHARGAQVYISGRNCAALDAFLAAHPGAAALPLDVTDREQVGAAAARLTDPAPPDLVVYCAAHYKEMATQDFDLDEVLTHQRVNYGGALHVIGAVLPALLRDRRGHISLLASVAGLRGLPRSVAYGPRRPRSSTSRSRCISTCAHAAWA
jgi:NAD(P)-dependent dehydrogenase (short-subunit alcohol dehydrogenase family)